MMRFKLLLILVWLLGISALSVFAQEAIPAAGSDATGTGGSASYSVGQVLYTTESGSNGSAAKGVQQPYEIFATVGIKLTSISLGLDVYPNPATDILILRVEDITLLSLSLQLYDIHGKLLEGQKIVENSTSIKMENLPCSTYFLKVLQNQRGIKTFKIIKN